MSPAEKSRVILAGLAVAAIYALAGWFLLGAVVQRFARRRSRLGPGWRALRLGVYALALAGIGCGLYARFVEPWWLEVTYTEIASPKVASEPIRIVHFTDTHSEADPRTEEDIPAAVAEQRPDLILFTGDAINDPNGLATFNRLMRRLAEIAPVYAVRGNWDIYRYARHVDFQAVGADELIGPRVRLDVRGTPVSLIGAPALVWGQAAQALAAAPNERLKIVLYHYPDRIPAAAELGADLYLAGHTHGGQIALPFYGALVTLAEHGKRFESGHYRVHAMDAYVGRGLGLEGGRAPRVRFCARPELTVIVIKPR